MNIIPRQTTVCLGGVRDEFSNETFEVHKRKYHVNAVSARYGVRAHPVAYFIDAEGNLMSVVQGYREWDSKNMKTLLASLMPGRESREYLYDDEFFEVKEYVYRKDYYPVPCACQQIYRGICAMGVGRHSVDSCDKAS